MNCNACKSEMPNNSKFCPDCGATVLSSIKICTFCGAQNEPNSTFCSECGKPQNDNPVSANNTGIINSNNDFIYLLSEEKLKLISSVNWQIPYGCVAVILEDGLVVDIREQDANSSNRGNIFTDFIKQVSDFAKNLGQKEKNVKTFILINLKDLPVITYIHPVPLPGAINGVLRFDFWVEVDGKQSPHEAFKKMGLFFQKCIQERTILSLNDFRSLAIANIPSLIKDLNSVDYKSQEIRDQLTRLLFEATGITAKCSYQKGRVIRRRQIEVSKLEDPVSCPCCDSLYFSKVKFCEICGHQFTNAIWVAGTSTLRDLSGEQLVLRLSIVEDVSDDIDSQYYSDESISRALINFLGPILQERNLATLMTASVLTDLSMLLNKNFLKDFQGAFLEITVSDIKTAHEDWFFKTDSLIKEEMRRIESDKKFLQVDGAEIDLHEASFAITMRKIKQRDSEEFVQRKATFDALINTSEIEIDEHELETKKQLRKETIDEQAEEERLRRETAKLLREREFERVRSLGDRENELAQADHEMGLEKSVVKHDIDIADITGEAESRAKRRDVSDSIFEQEELIRLEAAKKAQLGYIEEDLQDRHNQREIDKLAKMAEIEATMAKQDMDFELQKTQLMRGMNAQEILAMQAAQLAKSGGESAVEVVKSIAQSQADAAGAAIKEQLYKEMLTIQQNSTTQTIDAYKNSVVTALQASEDMVKVANTAMVQSIDGYKDAAKIAQSTNEKSMESMAKVSAVAANRKVGKEDTEQSVSINCVNPECSHVFDSKGKKFCPKCGSNQSEG